MCRLRLNQIHVDVNSGEQHCQVVGDIPTERSDVLDSGTESVWQQIDNHAQNMNRSVIQMPGDGHCLIHAVRRSLSEENIDNLSHDQICFKLKNEIITNKYYYDDFAGDRDIVKDIENYIMNKAYNNDTIDLVLAALCNCLGVSAILYQVVDNNFQISAHAPGREGVMFRGDIHIAQNGENGGSHYNCVGRCDGRTVNAADIERTPGKESRENGKAQFSPEDVRPYPKAPPRKGTAKRKKRRTAILTDTPEKALIEEEFQKRSQSKSKPKQKQKQNPSQVKTKPNENKAGKRKLVQKKRKIDTSSDSDDEEWYCLICVEPYSNSKAREKWVQCVACKDWAHEECTAVPKGNVFVCQNCESDYDSESS